VTAIAQRTGFTIAALGMLAACVLPLSNETASSLSAHPTLLAANVAGAILFAGAGWLAPRFSLATGLAGVVLGCFAMLALLRDAAVEGHAAWGFWLPVLAIWLAAAVCVAMLAAIRSGRKTAARALDVVIPLLFGAFVLYLWEVAVRGFGVPSVLLPAPGAIAARSLGSLWTLWLDFFQTFVLGVLSGYVIGCGAGFLVAIVANRFTFLGRGLLPIGNFVSALPIVGIAPIMVMWFGFDWPSKAAVVTVHHLFPDAREHARGSQRCGTYRARPDAFLWGRPSADAGEALFAGRHAVHLQRAEDQFDACIHRRNCRGIFRHTNRGNRLSYLD
jgi:NitT/TauT family transport system permease protein